MNAFQKQLILDHNKTMAELHNEGKTLIVPNIHIQPVDLPPPPIKVSVLEFLADGRSKET